jgi:hypothetical protein
MIILFSTDKERRKCNDNRGKYLYIKGEKIAPLNMYVVQKWKNSKNHVSLDLPDLVKWRLSYNIQEKSS